MALPSTSPPRKHAPRSRLRHYTAALSFRGLVVHAWIARIFCLRGNHTPQPPPALVFQRSRQSHSGECFSPITAYGSKRLPIAPTSMIFAWYDHMAHPFARACLTRNSLPRGCRLEEGRRGRECDAHAVERRRLLSGWTMPWKTMS